MKSKFTAIALLFAAVFSLASCLKDDNNEYVYTDDSAIATFSVQTAKQYVHTTSKSGADSVYTRKVSLASYPFVIDQKKCEIYNPDSLPYGVDARKLLVSTSAYSSGTVYIQSPTSDSVAYVTSTDSLDFSKARILQAVSMSGQAMRKYVVTVNVHKEAADSFVWSNMPATELARQFDAIRTAAVSTPQGVTRLFMLGTNGTSTTVLTMTDGGAWAATSPIYGRTLAADTYRSAVVKNDSLYICDNHTILRTADGNSWQVVADNTMAARLVAANDVRMYAYNDSGVMIASDDNGATWHTATIDSDAALLPLGETTYATMPLTTNKGAYRTLIVGTRPGHNDSSLTVWGKIDEADRYSDSQPWAYYPSSAFNHMEAPLLGNPCLAHYGGYLLLTGTAQNGVAEKFYKSVDGGLTWQTDSVVTYPGNFGATGACAMTVDSRNFVWIVNAKTGQTMRGRTNRLGWKKEQYEYND